MEEGEIRAAQYVSVLRRVLDVSLRNQCFGMKADLFCMPLGAMEGRSKYWKRCLQERLCHLLVYLAYRGGTHLCELSCPSLYSLEAWLGSGGERVMLGFGKSWGVVDFFPPLW